MSLSLPQFYPCDLSCAIEEGREVGYSRAREVDDADEDVYFANKLESGDWIEKGRRREEGRKDLRSEEWIMHKVGMAASSEFYSQCGKGAE